MLNSIEFKEDFRCFKAGEKFEFRSGVNLIVGDQGSGKTTIMEAFTIKKSNTPLKVDGEPCSWYHFDFEKDNPRTRSNFKTGFDLASRFSSHGESNIAILNMLTKSKDLEKPTLILMDEADMALSIRSCYKLIDLFKKLVKKGHQIVAIVHNPIIILAFNEVLSLEHRCWMTSNEFIESQKKPRIKNEIRERKLT